MKLNYKLTEFELNKRFAEIIGHKTLPVYQDGVGVVVSTENDETVYFNPSANSADCWPIIEKCWGELFSQNTHLSDTEWERLVGAYGCTKLQAACICLVENYG